ncbi:MAG: hypothetical protein EKK52_01290 [Burkholderiales bacterium]|jgi:hypothetical protein|nr:MAG: hypothetical protein EKK52_01290 [Burkholderiales bacterium]
MAATGALVDGPLAAVALVNAQSLPSAQLAYRLMNQMLGEQQFPLILASLPLSLTAVAEGLLAYEASLALGETLQKSID